MRMWGMTDIVPTTVPRKRYSKKSGPKESDIDHLMLQLAAEKQLAMEAPSPIRQMGNNIYFFAEIMPDTIADLLMTLKALEADLLKQQIELGLDTPAPIHLHINSGGGDSFSGFAAANAIQRCRVPVHTHVCGYAASSATLLIMAGAKRTIQPHAFMLIHQLSSEFWGNFEQMKDQMSNSVLIMGNIGKFYTARSKLTQEQLEEILKKDLLFDAETCLQYGMIDAIE